MTTFDDKEKAFENKYAHDEELNFKANARRNKLLGLWAADKLHKKGSDAEAYAKEVVTADFEKPGHEDVVEKIMNDFTKAGLPITAKEIREQMAALLPVARQQIMSE